MVMGGLKVWVGFEGQGEVILGRCGVVDDTLAFRFTGRGFESEEDHH